MALTFEDLLDRNYSEIDWENEYTISQIEEAVGVSLFNLSECRYNLKQINIRFDEYEMQLELDNPDYLIVKVTKLEGWEL